MVDSRLQTVINYQKTRENFSCYSPSFTHSCPSFVYTVLVKEDCLLCKHMLAVQLARALGQCKEVTISDEEMGQLLCSDESAG